MKSVLRKMPIMAALVVFIFDICAIAQDWPQWRGINRDAKVTGFKAPAAWPKTLTKKWNITVGEGTDSTPVIVGDKLYVFTRQAGEEILLCLNAETGKEIWRDKYAVAAITGVDNQHPGPRSSPVVANGKICTLGVTGILSCLDAATGKLIWRKDDFPGAFPRFHTAMSPIIVDNFCIGHFGSADNGAVAAYDLAAGDIKWKWSGGSGFGPTYASPVLATLGGIKQVLVQTEKNVVSISLDGKLLWQEASAGGRYGASSPVVDETNSIVFGMRGNGSYAIKIIKEGEIFKTEQLWSNADTGTEYNTPVLKNGFLFGINPRNNYFCIDAKTGTTAWSVPPTTATPAAALLTDTDNTLLTPAVYNGSMVITPAAMGGGDRGGRGGGMGGMGGGGSRGGRGGGMGGGVGYGTIVDAGSVLFGLISNGRLVVYEPNEKEYKELAAYQVTSGQVYAYQIVSGNRIYTSDQTSVTLWTIE